MALGNRLRGKPCQAHGSELKIAVAGSIRYPDAFVVCSTIPRGTTVVTDPVVVFEVLSPSTSTTDRIVKNQEYRDTPSIQRYVMLEQDRQAATVFARAGDDWVGHVVSGDAVLAMPEIGIELPLAELYEGVRSPRLKPRADRSWRFRPGGFAPLDPPRGKEAKDVGGQRVLARRKPTSSSR